MSIENDLELMILSCDKYSSLWEHHINLLKKNLIFPISVSLVSESDCEKSFDGIRIIAAGKTEFSKRLEFALSQVKSDYVLLILDDYFLSSKVSSDEFERVLNKIRENNIDYLRLYEKPRRSIKEKLGEDIYKIDTSLNYSVNLFPGIWKTAALKTTITNPASAWEYEVSLSKTASEKNFNCAYYSENIFPIKDILRKGKIKRNALKFLKKENIKLEKETHSVFSEGVYNIKLFLSENLPRPIFKFVKKTLKKLGFKFYSDI